VEDGATLHLTPSEAGLEVTFKPLPPMREHQTMIWPKERMSAVLARVFNENAELPQRRTWWEMEQGELDLGATVADNGITHGASLKQSTGIAVEWIDNTKTRRTSENGDAPDFYMSLIGGADDAKYYFVRHDGSRFPQKLWTMKAKHKGICNNSDAGFESYSHYNGSWRNGGTFEIHVVEPREETWVLKFPGAREAPQISAANSM
jgi:hypothetical protein